MQVPVRNDPAHAPVLQAVADRLLRPAGLLEGDEGGAGAGLKRWPGKQKQQAAAGLWLALH